MDKKCAEPTCNRIVKCRGLCGAHYYRFTVGADMSAPVKTPRNFQPAFYRADPKLTKKDFARIVKAQEGACGICRMPTPVEEFKVAHREKCYRTVHHIVAGQSAPFHIGTTCVQGLVCRACKHWWDT